MTFWWEQLPSLLWQFFESTMLKVTLKVTWSQLCLKFVLKPHWQKYFKKQLEVQLKILETRINIRAHLSGPIIMKLIKGNQQRCLQNYRLQKKPGLHLKEHFTNMENGISLILCASVSAQETWFQFFNLI